MLKGAHLLVIAALALAFPAWGADPPPSDLSALPGVGGRPIACAYCDLRGMDLSGQALTDANFTGADLRGVKLRGTVLDGAILIGADLRGADLTQAQLGTSARGPADLSGAQLGGASFQGAKLASAHLMFATLEGTDFSGADLGTATLGPLPRTGVLAGRPTTFRGARVARRFTPDPATTDTTDIIWVQPTPAPRSLTSPSGVACGSSDLSGLTSAVYAATTGSDTATCGASPAQACQSLAFSISRCGAGDCNVLAMYGEFTLPSTLTLNATTAPRGVKLYGGCVPVAEADPNLRSVIQAPGSDTAAIIADHASPVALENLKVIGSRSDGPPGSGVATVVLTNGAIMTVANSELVGGNGVAGSNGTNQQPGTAGGGANGQTGGTTSSCAAGQGGMGAGSMNSYISWAVCYWPCSSPGCTGSDGQPAANGSYASGGKWGGPYTAVCPPITPNDGNGGAPGANGQCGSGGPAAPDIKGSFAGPNWAPGAGASGIAGNNGSGGGGGGSGGGVCGFCILAPWTYAGSQAGGGGAGGCSGSAGTGGQQGGGSFVVVASASQVTLNTTRVIPGRGGNGGTGGTGGNGGAGGAFAAGSGTSGYGWHGGKGGQGGLAAIIRQLEATSC